MPSRLVESCVERRASKGFSAGRGLISEERNGLCSPRELELGGIGRAGTGVVPALTLRRARPFARIARR